MTRVIKIVGVLLCVFLLAGTAFAEGQGEKQKAEEEAAEGKEYTFYYVSHIGPADPNMKWLTLSSKAFEEKFPNVTIEYVAPENFSVKKQVEMLKSAIAKNPDGLIVPITDAQALDPVLRDAIENQGIPVIAANIPDFREKDERIPYLSYVGGDEYLTGYELGKRLARAADNGTIPEINKVVTAIQHVGHTGLEMRAKGMADAMSEIGVEAEKLAIGDNPSQGKQILNSYMMKNKDEVNVIYTVASWTAPWAYEVASNLNLSPDVDKKGVTILTVDASPVALEGIIEGKLLATHSQGFWMQGWVPAEWLYFYNELGYTPPDEILTGPIIIDKSNVQTFKNTVMNVFGEDTYEGLILWK